AGTVIRATSCPELTNLVDLTCTFVVSPANDHAAEAPVVKPVPKIFTSSVVSCAAAVGATEPTVGDAPVLPPPGPLARLAPRTTTPALVGESTAHPLSAPTMSSRNARTPTKRCASRQPRCARGLR